MNKIIKNMVAIFSVVMVCAPVGAIAANKLIVQDNSATPVDKMVVTDTGFIGVGTSTPFSAVNAVGTTNQGAQILAHTIFTGKNGGGSFVGLHNNSNGSLPTLDDRLGYFYFGSKSINTYVLGGGMSVYADGPWSAYSWPTYFKFETAPANPNPATVGYTRIERMRITSEGNIGIGTASPKQRIEINGGVRLNTPDSKPACSDASRGTIWIEQGTTDVLYVCVQIGGTPAWKVVTLN